MVYILAGLEWTPDIQQLKHSWLKTTCSANTDCVQISHPGCKHSEPSGGNGINLMGAFNSFTYMPNKDGLVWTCVWYLLHRHISGFWCWLQSSPRVIQARKPSLLWTSWWAWSEIAPSCTAWLYPQLMFLIPTAVLPLVSSALEIHSSEPVSSILRMS